MQGYQDYRDTCRFRDTGILEIQGYRDTRMQGFIDIGDTGITGYREVSGYSDFKLQCK